MKKLSWNAKATTALAVIMISAASSAFAYTAPSGTLVPSASLSSGAAAPRANTISPPSGPLISPRSSYQAPAGMLAPAGPLVAPQRAPVGSPLPSYPAPATSPSGTLFAVPTPNGFIAGGATASGHGGLIQHQDHGGGYQTKSGTYFTPKGEGFGATVTTGPNGAPIGGTVTGTKSY